MTLRAAEVRPGDLFAALPGARVHGADFVGQAHDAGAVAVLTDPAGLDRARAADLPVVLHPQPRTVLGLRGRHRLRRPDAAAAGSRRHRDQRQDHGRAPARGRAGRSGPDDRVDRDRRHPHRRSHAAQCLHHSRGSRPAGAVRRDARRRRHGRRDGGVEPRARPRPRRRYALRRRRLHQPLAGPPRLPRRHGRLLRREGVAVRARPGRARGDLRRRRVGRPAGRPDARGRDGLRHGPGRLERPRRHRRHRRHPALHRTDPARTGAGRAAPAGAVQRRERPGGAGLPGRRRRAARGRRPRRRRGRRPRSHAADRARAAVPGGRRLRPQARRGGRRSSTPCVRRWRGGCWSCSAPGATATGPSDR